jgi:cell wall-associated NlpC family hydrolase
MKAVLALAAVVLVVLPVGLAVAAGGVDTTATAAVARTVLLADQTCPLSGPVAGLDAAQAANADTVVAAAMSAAGEDLRVAHIAVMVAVTESDLRNLDHGDRDSLGLFQQRPSQGWGTPAQIMDPTYAATAFVTHLLAVGGWRSMPPWLAAQQVQRSAYADGSNYRANWAAAGSILPAGYRIPPGTPPEHAAVVAFVLAQLGKPYVWGAAGPAAFDCSGLTMTAWAGVGVSLDHYTGDQQREGVPVTPTALTPGDLVLVPGSDSPGPGIAGHVGIYLGDGLVASAIDPAMGVAVQTWSAFVAGGLLALRDPAPGH